MPTISLLKKYKNKKNSIIFKKSVKLNIFVFIQSNVKIYNGKELKKIELIQYNKNYNDKIGSFVQTRYFRQKKIKNKSKIKK